jgi:RNA polymerase sigma factor (sigma-70 family)
LSKSINTEQIKFIGLEKTHSDVNKVGDCIQNEEALLSFEIGDSFRLDIAEPECEFRVGALQSTKAEKEQVLPHEQFRLLYAYFKDMASEPLLTPKQEIEISSQIKKCEAMEMRIKAILDELSKARIRRSEEISKKNIKRKALSNHVQRLNALGRAYSEKAKGLRERFVKSNLKLVISMAKRNTGRGLPLSDLIQEGNLGLIKAVEGFDHTKGYKFSTYALWWIHQAMSRALLNQVKAIRVPVYVFEKAIKAYRIHSMLYKKTCRKPMPEEVAAKVGISTEAVKWILDATNKVVHLDSPIWDGEKTTLLEFITDDDSPTQDSITAMGMLTQRIREAILILTPREREIIRMRFGIDREATCTLDEIGKRFSLSRERIRQIELEALKKLAASKLGEALRSFLE